MQNQQAIFRQNFIYIGAKVTVDIETGCKSLIRKTFAF